MPQTLQAISNTTGHFMQSDIKNQLWLIQITYYHLPWRNQGIAQPDASPSIIGSNNAEGIIHSSEVEKVTQFPML